MKGAEALASGMLVLAAICAAPAISAAQDQGTATTVSTTTTTTTTPTPPATAPVDQAPAGGADKPDKRPAGSDKPSAPAEPLAAAPDQSTVTVSQPAGKAHAAASASVSMVNFAFAPTSVTVAVGDTVTWTNHDNAPHNATANDGSFKTPDINDGQSASHTFNSPGTFSYICTIHPNMHGTVRVLSSSSGEGGGGGSAGASSSGSSQSEASAVASPSAAGDSNTLPMTGMAVGALALVGLALLNSGLLVRAWHRRAGRERQLRLF